MYIIIPLIVVCVIVLIYLLPKYFLYRYTKKVEQWRDTIYVGMPDHVYIKLSIFTKDKIAQTRFVPCNILFIYHDTQKVNVAYASPKSTVVKKITSSTFPIEKIYPAWAIKKNQL